MGFKTDKEYEERDDISLLSEIIANSIYWQGICKIYGVSQSQYIWGIPQI